MKALRALPIVLLVGALVAAADARKRDDSSKVRRARGEVTDVRPGDNQFTLRTRDGKELKFDMDRDAQVRIDGRASDLAGLKKGMRVVVRYEGKGDKHHVVFLRTTLASSPTLRDEVRDVLRTVKDLAYQQRDMFEDRVREALHKAEDRIDELQDRAESAEGKRREQLQDAVKDLRNKQEKLRERLDRAKSAKSETWNEAKAEVRSALEELQGALQRAAAASDR